MSTPGERAAARLNQFAAQHGDAVRLARLASLAVRIDAPLLRALRLRFLPGTDAGIEADLWFSPLTESMSSQGLVLAPPVADLLRTDLAAERAGGEQRLLDAAATLIDDAHRDWPASLRMEERITWLALKADPGSIAEADALLRQAAKAMVEDQARGMEIARWALRALPRLPAPARATDAALLLALGASERLGGRVVFASDEQRATPLPDAAWILPPETLARRTRIGVRRLRDGLQFIDADGAELTFELPATAPLVVELRWSEGDRESATTLGIQPGRQVPVPVGASGIRIRTLAGDEFALDRAGGEGDEPPDASAPVKEGVVRVRFQGPALTPSDARGLELAGFFVVARDLVLTLAGGESPRMDEGLRFGSWTVERDGNHFPAKVDAIDGALVLLRLPDPMPGAVLLERAGEPVAIEPDMQWKSVRVDDDGMLSPVSGRIVSIIHNSMLIERVVGGGRMLELEADLPLDQPGSVPGRMQPLAGAPILHEGRVIGLVAGTSRPTSTPNVVSPAPASPRLLAVPVERLNDFIYRSLRPAEHEPTVVVAVSAPRLETASLERIKAALRAARVRPWIDSEQMQPGIAFEESMIAAVNDSEGSAIVRAGESPSSGEHEQRQLRLIAFRRWAKPDYPVAIFEDSRTPDVSRQRSGRIWELIRPLHPSESGPPPAFDAASDADLAAYAERVFEPLGRLRDAGTGEAMVMRRLASLIAVPGAEGEGSTPRVTGIKEGIGIGNVDEGLRAIQRDGLFARIDWPAWLQAGLSGQPETARRELIDTAATFTLPASTAQRVRFAAIAPRERRAICLNAMPVTIARALIRRAWIGEAPPVSLVFREQDWPSLGSNADAPHRVAAEVGRVLDCDEDTAQQMLRQVSTPVFLIFATRPLPSRAYLDTLQEMLPHAVLFFLCGAEKPGDSLLDGGALAELPALADDQHEMFIRRYKELMQLAVPRHSAGPAADRAALKRAPRRPKAPRAKMK